VLPLFERYPGIASHDALVSTKVGYLPFRVSCIGTHQDTVETPGIFDDPRLLPLRSGNEPFYLHRHCVRLPVLEREREGRQGQAAHRRESLRFDDGIAGPRISNHLHISGEKLPALQLRRGRHRVEQHPVKTFADDRPAYLDLHV